MRLHGSVRLGLTPYDGKNMSLAARNVDIITIGGRVTLRGPVSNEREKHFIGDIANRIVPSRNADNQLQVKVLNQPGITATNP